MSDLPNDPNPSSPADKDQVFPVSGSKGPEGGALGEGSASVEKQPEPETLKSPEKVPTPKPTPEENEEETVSDIVPETPTTEGSPKIVDKTDELTSLHQIKEPQDKLTKEADEEEERFIEEVEKHHGDV